MAFAFDVRLRERLIEHLVTAVEVTRCEHKPFPHLRVRQFLPVPVYDELLLRMPARIHYEPFDYHRHQQDGISNRHRFRLCNAWLDTLSGGTRTFWYTIRSAFGSRELKRAMFRQLSPGLSLRFGAADGDAADLPGYASPELFHETHGYRIKPQRGSRRQVVTMQLALAEDASQEHLGTEFYRRSLNPVHWWNEPRGFKIERRMPFLPNTAYAFVVLHGLTRNSWQGRTTIPGDAGSRNSLLNNWYASPEDANADLIVENEELARSPSLAKAA